MASEVVNLRERIEKVRAEMAGEDLPNDKNFSSDQDNNLSDDIYDNRKVKSFQQSENKTDLPDFKLTVQNPVSPKVLLFLIIMQLITSIILVTVIYFK